MPQADFVHLHNHSQYSLLDGATRLTDMVAAAVEFDMPALALTDHGNLFGAVHFYRECRRHNIKPIIGCEAYVAHDDRTKKEPVPGTPSGGYHLILLARNETGYRNLVKLTSAAYLEGFYHRPRIDHELLRTHSDGLIATSACVKGEIPHNLNMGREDKARETALRYREYFDKDAFYIEIQNHGIDIEDRLRPQLIQLARDLEIPLVGTNDSHYLRREHAAAHDALLCIQTGKFVSDADRMRYNTDQIYFKSPEEMKGIFAGTTDAIDNTLRIAEACEFEMEFGRFHLPDFPLPEGFETPDDYVRHLCETGLTRRYPTVDATIRDRLDYELRIIGEMGFAGYFLIVQDFIDYARKRGIPVGPGRGSAAGSIVAYVLGITNVDPMAYGLLFERFLNPERISMPDIDIDFSDRGRDEIIQYVIRKYGRDHVCQIITFGTMAARAVLRDVGRVLGVPYGEVDRLAKMVPEQIGISLEAACRQNPELPRTAARGDRTAQLLEHSRVLEGLTRHASTHAAGVVITPKPLTEFVPLYKSSRDEITTQFDMKAIDAIGLLKMDFLGLRTLSVIEDALRHVKINHDTDIDLDALPPDDAETFAIFAAGETTGIFQFESSGMRDYIRKLRPERIEDLVAMNALYRPGPLDARAPSGAGNMIDEYIERKQGRRAVTFDHPRIEKVLKDTYGVIVYQDQVMQVAGELAGFSMARADHLRKAMGKKDSRKMAQMKEDFIAGAVARGCPRKVADSIFDYMETFARYGFNRAHSVCYAVLAYQTGYLKAHYPVEFMAAVLTSESDNADRIRYLMQECRRLGITIRAPDINRSYAGFTPAEGEIRFGLAAVKNVGEAAVQRMIEARDHDDDGPFKSLFDFCSRVDSRALNRRTLEALIGAGAFDTTGGHRAQFTDSLARAINFGQRVQAERESGQKSLFESAPADGHGNGSEPQLEDCPPWSISDVLKREKEALGFYVSGHPLERFREDLQLFANSDTETLDRLYDEAEVVVGALIIGVKHSMTKKQQPMAFLTLEDFSGTVEAICFPETYARHSSDIAVDSPVLVTGKLSTREGERPKIMVDALTPLEGIRAGETIDVHIDIDPTNFSDSLLDDLDRQTEPFSNGNGFLFFHIRRPAGEITVRTGSARFQADRGCLKALRELFGADAVRCARG